MLKPIGGEWVDVFALDEKLWDSIPGFAEWTNRNGKWTSPLAPGERNTAAVLPLCVTGSYNLVAEVTHDSGGEWFGILLPIGSNRVIAFDLNSQGGTSRGTVR